MRKESTQVAAASAAAVTNGAQRVGRLLRVAVLLATLVGGLAFASSAEAEEDEEKLNELALVLAATHEEGDTFFTVGAEYERDLGQRFAVSGIFEYVNDSETREFVFAVPFAVKVAGGLKVFAGPGVVRKDESRFLFRLGAGWAFDLGERWAITPGIELDLVDGEDGLQEAWVLGASVGYRF